MNLLIDSDVLIEITRGRDQKIISQWMDLAESDDTIFCSPISSAELWTGARPQEHGAIANLFQTLLCVPIDYESGRKAGEFLRHYRKSHGLEMSNAMIAAAAVLNEAALWTRNRKHYPMREIRFY